MRFARCSYKETDFVSFYKAFDIYILISIHIEKPYASAYLTNFCHIRLGLPLASCKTKRNLSTFNISYRYLC